MMKSCLPASGIGWEQPMMIQVRDRVSISRSCIFAIILCATGATFFAWDGVCAELDAHQPSLQDHVSHTGQELGRKWIGTVDLIGEYNPRGIDLTGGIDYRDSYRYSDRYDAVSAYWQTGAALAVNPSFVQPSVDIEWMPWLFLTLRLQGDGYYFLGANGGLLSFSSPQEPFGDSVRRDRRGTEETGYGRRVLFQPTVQMKAGDFILRNQSDLARYWFPGKGPYFLELEYDTLLKNGDNLFANRTQVLEEINISETGTLLAGPFYEIVRAETARLTRQRIGFLVYAERAKTAWFGATRYYVQIGYNLKDPNRAQELFFVIGLGREIDIKF